MKESGWLFKLDTFGIRQPKANYVSFYLFSGSSTDRTKEVLCHTVYEVDISRYNLTLHLWK